MIRTIVASKMLGISDSYLRRLCRLEVFDRVKIGKIWYLKHNKQELRSRFWTRGPNFKEIDKWAVRYSIRTKAYRGLQQYIEEIKDEYYKEEILKMSEFDVDGQHLFTSKLHWEDYLRAKLSKRYGYDILKEFPRYADINEVKARGTLNKTRRAKLHKAANRFRKIRAALIKSRKFYEFPAPGA